MINLARKTLWITGALLLLIIGFAVGCLAQHARTGYHYKVREERAYASLVGVFHWRYVTESVGTPFLDPGTTIIEFQGRRIYSAPRQFQESGPYARNIVSDQNKIDWEDGDFRFSLTITPSDGQPGRAQKF